MAGHGLDKGNRASGTEGGDKNAKDRPQVQPPNDNPISKDIYKKPDTPEAQNSTTASQARIANPAVNQTFKVENGDKPQTISGKVTKENDGSFKVETQDGKHFQVTTDKDGHAQKLTEINKDTGKPIGEPQRVTSERNGLPTAAEIKKNAEISQPSQTTKLDSHEPKGNAEQQKSANPHEKVNAEQQKNINPQDQKQATQNEKANPNGAERGGNPRDGGDLNLPTHGDLLHLAGCGPNAVELSQLMPDSGKPAWRQKKWRNYIFLRVSILNPDSIQRHLHAFVRRLSIANVEGCFCQSTDLIADYLSGQGLQCSAA